MVHIDKPIMDKVRNLSIHVKNKFLPYGIILLVVGGIGIFYDDRSSVPIKEEEKLAEASSPPLCSAPKKEEGKQTEGTLVFSPESHAASLCRTFLLQGRLMRLSRKRSRPV